MKSKVIFKPKDNKDMLLLANINNMHDALFEIKYNLLSSVKDKILKEKETISDAILERISEIIECNNLTDDII